MGIGRGFSIFYLCANEWVFVEGFSFGGEKNVSFLKLQVKEQTEACWWAQALIITDLIKHSQQFLKYYVLSRERQYDYIQRIAVYIMRFNQNKLTY